MRPPRVTGTVGLWNGDRKFGFVTFDDGRDAFIHIQDWLEDDNEPSKGERISCVEEHGRKGLRARQVMRHA